MEITINLPDRYVIIIDRMIRAGIYLDREQAVKSLSIHGLLHEPKAVIENLDFYCKLLDEIDEYRKQIEQFMEK